MPVKVTVKEIRGVMRDIHVDERGIFYHVLDSDTKVTAPTLEILEKKLITATAPERQNLGIKFVRIDNRTDMVHDPSLLHGTATGKHATNSNMLVRFDGQRGTRQEVIYSFGRQVDDDFLRMDEHQEAILLQALQDETAAHRRVEKLIQQYRFDAKAEVQAALKKLGVQDE